MGEVEMGIEAHLKSFGSKLDAVDRKLRRWAYQLRRVLSPVSGVGVTGQALVFNLGSPPAGYYWRVRGIQVTPPTPVPLANVNLDIYVSAIGQPAPGYAAATQAGGLALPSIGDWWASNYTSTASNEVPAAYFPSSRELDVYPGDSVIAVISGAGVTTGQQFYASGAVDQYEGFAGLSGD